MRFLRKTAVIMLGAAMLSTAFMGAASAQQYPNVSNLTPFSAQADFMSLSGYLRYVSYQQSNVWLTHTEALRIVQQQHN
jgi:hypothetical protein